MYVISAHQRHRQTDRQTDVKRSHDRYIAKACSGKNFKLFLLTVHFSWKSTAKVTRGFTNSLALLTINLRPNIVAFYFWNIGNRSIFKICVASISNSRSNHWTKKWKRPQAESVTEFLHVAEMLSQALNVHFESLRGEESRTQGHDIIITSAAERRYCFYL